MKLLKKKDLLLLANKLIEEILDPCNAKEYYQSIIKKKNKKSANETEIIFYQTKAFEHPKIVGIKSIITELSKSSYELPKNIRCSKHDPLAGSSYIKLPRELRYPRKGLIYIQNIDDIACFK